MLLTSLIVNTLLIRQFFSSSYFYLKNIYSYATCFLIFFPLRLEVAYSLDGIYLCQRQFLGS